MPIGTLASAGGEAQGGKAKASDIFCYSSAVITIFLAERAGRAKEERTRPVFEKAKLVQESPTDFSLCVIG